MADINPKEFARKVREMRTEQVLYLSGRNRSQTQLEKCKALEKEVDYLVNQVLGAPAPEEPKSKFSQTSMFS